MFPQADGNKNFFHDHEGVIEEPVLRITPSRVMTKGDPKGWIFLFHPHTNNVNK